MTHRKKAPMWARLKATKRQARTLKNQLKTARETAETNKKNFNWVLDELQTTTKHLKRATESLCRMTASFEIEKNAKNKAYSFILQRGLYEDWVNFSRANAGRDFHADCVNWFAKASEGGGV